MRLAAFLIALLCALPALGQQTQCAPADHFTTTVTQAGYKPTVSMTHDDGDRMEIWVSESGKWLEVFYPARGNGQVVCINGSGSGFETHFPPKTGRGV